MGLLYDLGSEALPTLSPCRGAGLQLVYLVFPVGVSRMSPYSDQKPSYTGGRH